MKPAPERGPVFCWRLKGVSWRRVPIGLTLKPVLHPGSGNCQQSGKKVNSRRMHQCRLWKSTKLLKSPSWRLRPLTPTVQACCCPLCEPCVGGVAVPTDPALLVRYAKPPQMLQPLALPSLTEKARSLFPVRCGSPLLVRELRTSSKHQRRVKYCRTEAFWLPHSDPSGTLLPSSLRSFRSAKRKERHIQRL